MVREMQIETKIEKKLKIERKKETIISLDVKIKDLWQRSNTPFCDKSPG